MRGPHQPLYANAPPKPRRLMGSREGSSSPEASDRPSEMAAGAQVPSRLQPPGTPPTQRRTPDAYAAAAPCVGRLCERASSATGPSPGPAQARSSYASSAGRSTHLSAGMRAGAVPLYGSDVDPVGAADDGWLADPAQATAPPYAGGRLSAGPGPARPHSADFLEWERRSGRRMMWPLSGGAARPSSSLAHCQPSLHDYWSEEGYANKMREAAYCGGVALQQAPAPVPATLSLGRDPERTPRGSCFLRSASARFGRQRARDREMMNTSLPDHPNDAQHGACKKIQQVRN